MKSKKSWHLHLTPLLITIFPILSLAMENIIYIQFGSIFRSVLLSVILVYIINFLVYFVTKDWNKARSFSSFLVILLLSYGKVYLFIEEKFGEALRHRYLLIIYGTLILFIGFLIIYKIRDLKNLNYALFAGGLVICSYLIITMGVYEYKQYKAGAILGDTESTTEDVIADDRLENLPDIYLIVLDAHTRSDVLLDRYGYDNSRFISNLDQLGFSTAKCAQSNYPGTNLSITSLFEMDYLHNVYEDYKNLVLPPLDNTRALETLESMGYKTAIFDNYFFDHFDIDEDILYSSENEFVGSVNEFEKILVDTSILRLLVDMDGLFPDRWVRPFEDDIYLTHYRDAVYTLDVLPELPKRDEQLFVYAHLLITHDPFVFLPDGSYGSSKQGEEVDYKNAIEFIDTVLPDIIDEIINTSVVPPIIIVMGDHGPSISGVPIEERMSILFSIYLQGVEPTSFYDEFTPVNAFRIIFNYLLKADYAKIDDISYPIWNISDINNISERVFAPCE